MAVIRINKNQNYTVMSNYHFKEKDMSLKAKGLLSLMLSLPDNWDYSVAGLVSICKESKTSIQSTLKELEGFGYLKRTRVQNSKGLFEYIYDIFEQPKTEKPQTENRVTDNRCTDNMSQLNTKQVNTKKSNTKDNNNIIDENFEKLWKMLKSTPNDRKAQVKPKRKKELYEMGTDRVEKAINLYLKVQDSKYYHKRDNFFNNIIDNYLDRNESDFLSNSDEQTSYDLDQYEKTSKFDPYSENF